MKSIAGRSESCLTLRGQTVSTVVGKGGTFQKSARFLRQDQSVATILSNLTVSDERLALTGKLNSVAPRLGHPASLKIESALFVEGKTADNVTADVRPGQSGPGLTPSLNAGQFILLALQVLGVEASFLEEGDPGAGVFAADAISQVQPGATTALNSVTLVVG